MATCSECSKKAEYVLVNAHHQPLDLNGHPVNYEPAVFCEEHAFEEGRLSCSVCKNFGRSVNVEVPGEGFIDLEPTYTDLGEDGYCADHP